jgi:CRP-like cAMP-binding protein
MAMREVPKELREQVYLYYRTLLLHKVGIEERDLMHELPHFLAEPLMGRLYEKIMGSPEEPMGGLKCWKQLGLDELPQPEQVEVCMRMLPFTVTPHVPEEEDAASSLVSDATISQYTASLGLSKTLTKDEIKAQRLDERVRLRTGYIFKQGEDDDRSIYFIREGTIELFEEDLSGKGVVSSIKLGRGDCFGQMCLSWLKSESEHYRLHSARALTDCSLYLLNRSALLDLDVSLPRPDQTMPDQTRPERAACRLLHCVVCMRVH